uniref:Uncharacterized protein n=1 Tax=Rhizophora mucronata TaxID=61149 RepID=A0A2P2Q6Q0_RHIMU
MKKRTWEIKPERLILWNSDPYITEKENIEWWKLKGPFRNHSWEKKNHSQARN